MSPRLAERHAAVEAARRQFAELSARLAPTPRQVQNATRAERRARARARALRQQRIAQLRQEDS